MLLTYEFDFLNEKISIWWFIGFFLIVSLTSLIIFLIYLFKSKATIIYNDKKLTRKEYIEAESFTTNRNNFELEIKKIKNKFQ